MPVYNFKTITVVPTAKDFIDIILSKTQRKTPTVVHNGYKISRIRGFYARKVKFTQQNYHDKITQILEDFPRLDDIHPFYADLINILYSKDHYKLALGQINMARQLIDNLGKDYLKLLKFGDSLYRCKELKRACLGRMCTVLKKLGPSLAYLEQVRQHLARLPSIDPSTRTVIITGYPNVGKSSFINKVSRANVEVQPYAFTTKSLFVGHTDYKYMRWQIIDTPGILDHPLEDRNTIEMQAITALAHLHCTVLFFVDISEQCGYTIKQQVALFGNIKPLFNNKPLLIVANKTDLKKLEDLDPEDQDLLQSMKGDKNTQILPMSNMTEEGINTVKTVACDMLLQHRVERKLQSKRINEVANRITVATPVPRDTKVRATSIPASVLEARAAAKVMGRGVVKVKRRTLKDVELEEGGPGIFSFPLQNHFRLANDDWKFDVMPEIIDGKNVADFVDPDIDQRLAELEEEEDRLIKAAEEAGVMDDESDLDEETKELAKKIKTKQTLIRKERVLNKSNNYPTLPRKFKTKSLGEVDTRLKEIGLDADKIRARSKSRGRKRQRAGEEGGVASMETGADVPATSRTRSISRAMSRSRSQGAGNRADSVTPGEGFRNVKQKQEARTMAKKAQRPLNQNAKQGESDRRVPDLKPKHLFAGKRGMGKTDRR